MNSISSQRRSISAFCGVTVLFALVSCQAPNARQADFSKLALGTHRADVHATLGPQVGEPFKDHDDTLIDSMRVEHGHGAGARAAEGTARWVFGVATIGMSEAAFKDTPPEPVSFKVFYDSDMKVRRVEPLNERAHRVFNQQRINSVIASERGAASSPGYSAAPPSARSGRPN